MKPWLFFFLFATSTCLFIMSCGNFTLDNPPDGNAANRRLYMNDQARSDSLIPAILRDGIKFVLQPNKGYHFSITTTRTKDRLKLFYYSGNRVRGEYLTLDAASNGTEEFFPLKSDQTTAQFFVAQLVAPDGKSAQGSLGRIFLGSDAPPLVKDTFNLRLIFVRTLKNLPDDATKKRFAESLFYYMAKVYGPYGIAIRGTYEIIEPTTPREIYPFGSFISLPGTRVTNNAHLYLVDSIAIKSANKLFDGKILLGFAPREVVNLDMHEESRVVLANRANPVDLAITAAHELGHFFGLRHTVGTGADLDQDNDSSNIDDGFTDTRLCSMAKVSASSPKNLPIGNGILLDDSHMIKTKDGTVYCLRMYSPAPSSECNKALCDIFNLMHPTDCPDTTQTQLSPQQVTFLKKNLAAYKH